MIRVYSFFLLTFAILGGAPSAALASKVALFDAVELRGALKATLKQSDEFAVEVVSGKTVLARVHKGSLKVDCRDGKSGEVIISAPSFPDLEIDGAADVTLVGIQGRRLFIDVSGTTTIRGTGKVDEIRAKLKGATHLHIPELETKSFTLIIEGTSEATVHATDKLRVDVNGMATVEFAGSPRIERTIVGMGEIRAYRPKGSASAKQESPTP